MTHRKFSRLKGLLGFLILTATLVFSSPVSAQTSIGGVETDCKFQTINPSGESILEIIFPRYNSGSNLVWDNLFTGFHKFKPGEWAGLDVVQPGRLPFKKGGVVVLSRSNYPGDGGNFIIIQGKGKCSDWLQGYVHVGYIPENTYPVGTEISPEDLVGIPSCSGFESHCVEGSTDGNNPPPHVHTQSLYCGSGNIDFGDGSSVDQISIKALGLSCQSIHPARLEDPSLHVEETNTTVVVGGDESEQSDFVGSGITDPTENNIGESSTQNITTGESKLGTPENPIWGEIQFPKFPFSTGFLITCFVVLMAVWAFLIFKRTFTFRQTPIPLAFVVALAMFLMGWKTLTLPYPETAKAQEITSEPTPTETELPPVSEDEAGGGKVEPEKQDDDDCKVSEKFPEDILQWCNFVFKFSKQNSLDHDLVAALIWQESGGDPLAYSKSGAVGLMQIMPRDGIASGFMCKNGPCFTNRPSISELQDPRFNIEYGTGMLKGLLDKYGDMREALKFYGPKDVGYYYADKVLGIYESYKK